MVLEAPEAAQVLEADVLEAELSLVAEVMGALEDAIETLAIAGQRLLVAVSGGVDSTVLLHALDRSRARADLGLVVAHVNHGLRGAESDADQAVVAELARKLGHPLLVAHVDPEVEREQRSSRNRPTLQEAARAARYRSLYALAHDAGATQIATAHNLDDQVETVLMRLLRGCGPDALGGIPERSPDGVVVRPLLAVSRRAILAYAREHELEWREDASNESRSYTRNRLRHDWIPGLAESFNPQLPRAVGDLAEAHRRDREWIGELVREAALGRLTPIGPDACELVREGWGDLPEALARRLVLRAVHELGGGRDLTRVHIERVLAFLRAGVGARGGAQIELPGGLRLARERNRFLLRRIGVKSRTSC